MRSVGHSKFAIYPFQLENIRKTNDRHINNISIMEFQKWWVQRSTLQKVTIELNTSSSQNLENKVLQKFWLSKKYYNKGHVSKLLFLNK